MALFKNLKLIKDAMSPEAIKQGLESSKAAMSGSPTGPTEEQLAAMPPEARAAIEANMAQVAAAQAQAAAANATYVDQEMGRRALYGEAGAYVYGDAPPSAEAMSAMTVEDAMAQSKEQFKDLLRNPLGRTKPPAAPGVPEGAVVDREAQAATERAARDAARGPYLAPDRAPLAFTRMATRGKTQLGEVAAYLGSSGLAGRPDLVFGVYRVPDHIGGGLTMDRSRVIEWDIVHAATEGLAPAPPATAAFFEGEEKWAVRRAGEPSVLDEDLALAYLGRAGIGPEQCLGLARFVKIKQSGGGGEGETSCTVTQVTGIHAFHPDGLGAGAFDALKAERPLPAGAVPGVHAEVLNWGAIRKAVHPETHHRFIVPSPFPHLPGTPQELLRAYVDIVGVRPSDCYSAQVTEDHPRDLTGVSASGGFFTMSTNRGESQPCADGEDRPRLTGGSRVVVVYRDRPEYAAGRERWAAYQRDVLQAALANGTKVRGPVEEQNWLERGGGLRRMVRGAAKVADFVDGDGNDPFADIPPHRYCWPPVK